MNILKIRYDASQFILHHPQINDAVKGFARNVSPIATQDTAAMIPTNSQALQNPSSAHKSLLTWGRETLEHIIPATRTKASRVASEDTTVGVDSPLATAISAIIAGGISSVIKIPNPADILVREAIYFDLQYGDPSNAQVEQYFATLKSLGVSDTEIIRASPGINSIEKKSPQERTAWRLFFEKMAAHPEWQWNCLMRLTNIGDEASLPVMEQYLTTTDEASLSCVLSLIGRFPESPSFQKAIDQIVERARSGNLELRSASGGRISLSYVLRYLFKTEDTGKYLAAAIAPIILDTSLPLERRLDAVSLFVHSGTHYNQTELKIISPGLNLAFSQVLQKLSQTTSDNDRFAIISHALQVMIGDHYSKEIWGSTILRATRILLDAGLAETQTMGMLWKP